MATKMVKKRKLKVFHFIVFLFLLALLGLFIYFMVNSKTKNIIIKNNNLLSDEEIITLDISENKPLFFYETNQKVVLENEQEVEINQKEPLRIPRVMNYVPNTKYQSLIKNIKKIDEDILGKISEMTYVPNEYDKDRFLLYMDDDNSVYLTLTKFKMINYYNKVLQQLEGKKGVLYLDNGNHFQIRSEG